MTERDFVLRPYEPADFNALYEIDQVCYAPDIAYSKRTLRWFLRQPGAVTLVATKHGELIGFIVGECEPPRAHIITLDVLEAHRRHGVGSLLLRETERQLLEQGVRRVGLETATDNPLAIAFWKKHGYRTVGLLKNYYRAGLDAHAMHKDLAAKVVQASVFGE